MNILKTITLVKI